MAVTSERPHATTSSDGTQKQVRYGDLTLYSAFQPIFSLSHMRAAGYEALLRAHNSLDASVSPLDVFGRAARLGDLLELDRLAQSLHLDNFRNLHCDREWLFVHIHPAALADQWQCAALLSELRRLGLKPQRIVLEVSDRQAADLRKLAEGVRIFRQYGFLIALDDFGAGHSNLDRIWQLDPDIVKLDRNIVFHASQRAQVARVLPGLISLLHEAGKLVLIEGIETEREALLAMEGDADFVQGSYFSRPAAAPVDTHASGTVLQTLFESYREKTERAERKRHLRLAPYMRALEGAAAKLASGEALDQVCWNFLSLEDAQRCYLLDSHGRQIGGNVVSHTRPSQREARFLPVSDAHGASWLRRPYFRGALNEPGRVHATRPYLSITEASVCVTLSMATTIGTEQCVLCGDVDWEPRQPTDLADLPTSSEA
jgi:EAL domain-containing protein (putative c-di-GMP-specific phosphodiesterase class I)